MTAPNPSPREAKLVEEMALIIAREDTREQRTKGSPIEPEELLASPGYGATARRIARALLPIIQAAEAAAFERAAKAERELEHERCRCALLKDDVEKAEQYVVYCIREWLLSDGTRLEYDEQDILNREHEFWWAADQIERRAFRQLGAGER